MSDTPRTDAAILASNGQWPFVLRDCSERLEREHGKLVLAEFARQLERELAEARGQERIHHDNCVSMQAQREKLAAALTSVASGAVGEANCIKIAREALAAVKGSEPRTRLNGGCLA